MEMAERISTDRANLSERTFKFEIYEILYTIQEHGCEDVQSSAGIANRTQAYKLFHKRLVRLYIHAFEV